MCMATRCTAQLGSLSRGGVAGDDLLDRGERLARGCELTEVLGGALAAAAPGLLARVRFLASEDDGQRDQSRLRRVHLPSAARASEPYPEGRSIRSDV